MMINSKFIGNKIAEARKKSSLSQAELSEKVSVSPQAVGKWERGESMPDVMTLNRLAEIFGVDLNYFSDSFQTLTDGTDLFESYKVPTSDTPIPKVAKKFDWNWDMSQGNWVDADFSGLKNLKEKFSSSNMRNCKFLNSDLSGLILGKNNIELCDFSGSNMRDCKIQLSNLLNDNFKDCSLIDTVFYKNNVEKCQFTKADFSGTEITESNLEKNIFEDVVWKFTKFLKSNISNTTFRGKFEDCHFEQCGFYNVKFENAIILNSFFKNNEKFKKVQFINCSVDKITYAFLKTNKANLTGISLIE